MISKLAKCMAYILFLVALLSLSLLLNTRQLLHNPNLTPATIQNFEYTDYNASIEQENTKNNTDINNGKIGYVLLINDKYSLVFDKSIHNIYSLPIYLTKPQLIEFKHLENSTKPFLVKAQIVDDGNSSEFYNIKVLDIVDNTQYINYISNVCDNALCVLIFASFGLIACIILMKKLKH